MTRIFSSLLLPILALGLAMNSSAANVLWNCFWQTGSGTEFEVCWYDTPDASVGVTAWADMYVTISTIGSLVTITPTDTGFAVGDWKWVVAKPGDVASEMTIKNSSEYFIRDKAGTEGPYLGDPVVAEKGASVYMMVMAEVDKPWWQEEPATPPYLYGWVELQVGQDGMVRLASSALDLDGGPMIVGGGSVIPEPSSILLLLFGGMVLVLRRGASYARCRPVFSEVAEVG